MILIEMRNRRVVSVLWHSSTRKEAILDTTGRQPVQNRLQKGLTTPHTFTISSGWICSTVVRRRRTNEPWCWCCPRWLQKISPRLWLRFRWVRMGFPGRYWRCCGGGCYCCGELGANNDNCSWVDMRVRRSTLPRPFVKEERLFDASSG
jgi:hypothetical protein